MEDLYIKESKYSPKILLNIKNSTLDITGNSYPEDSVEFYSSTMKHLNEYFNSKKESIIISIDLAYINSSSLKIYFDMFGLFENAITKGCNIKVNWIYLKENDIAEEIGEDFIDDFPNLNINLIAKSK